MQQAHVDSVVSLSRSVARVVADLYGAEDLVLVRLRSKSQEQVGRGSTERRFG